MPLPSSIITSSSSSSSTTTRRWSSPAPDDDAAVRRGNRRRRRRRVEGSSSETTRTTTTEASDDDDDDDSDYEDDSSNPVSSTSTTATGGGSTPQEELEKRLLQDIQRFKAIEQAKTGGVEEKETALAKASDVFSTILVVDFFVVMAFLTWFGVGIITKATTKDSQLLDTFYSLWNPVINPALGILMAGTMAGGGVGWLRKKFGGGDGQQ